MPKISYLDKDKSLVDDTEVTQEHIENKIAEIEALLRGHIDEDNLLSYRDDVEPIGIPPSLVADLPSETKPVNNCMKFFGKTDDHPDSCVETVFEKAIDLHSANPKYAVVNSLGDKEILIAYSGNTGDIGNKYNNQRIEIGFPSNYVPVTYRELWDNIKNLDFDVKSKLYKSGGIFDNDHIVLEGMWTSLEDFMRDCVGHVHHKDDLDPDSFVNEEVFDSGDNCFSSVVTDPVFNLESNSVSVSASVTVDDPDEKLLFRLVPSFLFRKIS